MTAPHGPPRRALAALLTALGAGALLFLLFLRRDGLERDGIEPKPPAGPAVAEPDQEVAPLEPARREEAPLSAAPSPVEPATDAPPGSEAPPPPELTCQLTGDVADPHGDLVAGLALHWRKGRLVLPGGVTDAFGAFRLSGLPCGAGELLLGAQSNPVAPPVRIELVAGGTDVGRLHVPALGRLSLQVLDEGGVPVASVALSGEGDRGGSIEVTSGPDGLAEATLLPKGMYRVFGSHPELGRGNTVFEFTPGETQGVVVQLRRTPR